MIASIHQPMFLQYLGLFRKIYLSDVFVIYNDVQYSRGDWHNRNKILRKNGPHWLTVPVAFKLGDTFSQARLADTNFIDSHLAIIKESYGKAPYFDTIYPLLAEAYKKPAPNLTEFNLNLFYVVYDLLSLHKKIVVSSELNIRADDPTERIIHICKALGADTYLAGKDPGYMDLPKFAEANIKVTYNDFVAQPYPQQFGGEFVPNLSVIDALFNIGPIETRKLIS